jgi:hypothetical protein
MIVLQTNSMILKHPRAGRTPNFFGRNGQHNEVSTLVCFVKLCGNNLNGYRNFALNLRIEDFRALF